MRGCRSCTRMVGVYRSEPAELETMFAQTSQPHSASLRGTDTCIDTHHNKRRLLQADVTDGLLAPLHCAALSALGGRHPYKRALAKVLVPAHMRCR